MSQRFEGRNLEEALDHATQTLGVERYQLTYHVLLEKRGFLGGMKRVVIEADINAAAMAPAVVPAPIPQTSPVAAPPPAARRERAPRGGRGGGGGGRGSDRDRGGRGRGP